MTTGILVHEVVRELGDARDGVMARFRAAGGSLDRWRASDWDAMREAITREEDARELRGARTEGLRRVRRRLEG